MPNDSNPSRCTQSATHSSRHGGRERFRLVFRFFLGGRSAADGLQAHLCAPRAKIGFDATRALDGAPLVKIGLRFPDESDPSPNQRRGSSNYRTDDQSAANNLHFVLSAEAVL